MLLVAALVGTLWFDRFERARARDNLQVQLAIVAVQLASTLQITETVPNTAKLDLLSNVEHLRWAVLLRDGEVLGRYRQAPIDLKHVQNELVAAGGHLMRTNRLLVSVPVFASGQAAGQLIAEADISDLNVQLGNVIIGALLLIGGLMFIALPVFHRLVRTVSDPLAQLARFSQAMTPIEIVPEGDPKVVHNKHRAGADDTASSKTEVADEIGKLGNSLNRMVAALVKRDKAMQDSRDALRKLTARLQSVREEERTRIAREIHDELGQRLTAIKLEASRLLESAGEDRIRLTGMIDETVKAVREISWELRPSVLDALGLTSAIEWLGEDFQRRMATRCRVEVADPPVVVGGDIATHLFRICQELLTNAARHARATRVDIRFVAKDGMLHLDIADNGVGMSATGFEQKSLGLLGIRERVHSLGGRVSIQTVPEFEGTRVSVVVPAEGMHSHTNEVKRGAT